MDLRFFAFNTTRGLKSLLIPLFKKAETVPFKPNFVSLEMANTCCLKCQHCDIWKNKKTGRKMTLKQMQQTISELHRWLGFFKLNLTGGEPFLNKETIPLIRFAAKSGIFTHANTNGYLFDEDLARQVVNSGINSLSFSLDSLDPKIHDQTRGRKETFARVTGAIELVNSLRKKKNLFLSLTTIIMEPNLGELRKIVLWAKEKQIDSVFFQPLWQNFGASYEQNWFKFSSLWPKDKNRIIKALDGLKKIKNLDFPVGNDVGDLDRHKNYFTSPLSFGDKYPCYVGLTNFAVDLYGDVRLCFNFPAIGNILKESPADIWNGLRAREQRKTIQECRRGCRVLLCNDLPQGKQLLRAKINQIKKVLPWL